MSQTLDQKLETLRVAILHRWRVSATCWDRLGEESCKVFCPHLMGALKENGDWVCVAWQVSSKSGDLPFDNAGRWVALPVESASCAARMENVRAHRGNWSTCGDYDPELASEQFESESIVELL